MSYVIGEGLPDVKQLAQRGGVSRHDGDLDPVALQVLPHGGIDLCDGQLGKSFRQLGDQVSPAVELAVDRIAQPPRKVCTQSLL